MKSDASHFQLPLRARSAGSLLVLAFLAGCIASEANSLPPPEGAFYYPNAITVLPEVSTAPERRFAVVSSSNFDRRFASGWLSLVDLDALQVASEPREAVLQQLAVPSFAGPMAFDSSSALVEGETRLLVFGHRGMSLLTLVQVTVRDGVPLLTCGDPDATAGLATALRYTDCDRRHLYALDDAGELGKLDVFPEVEALTDPYAVTFHPDPAGGATKLAVGFLSQDSQANTLLLSFALPAAANAEEPLLSPERVVTVGRAGLGPLALRPSVGCDGACPVHLASGVRRLFRGSLYSSVMAVAFEVDGTTRASVHSLANDTGGGQGGEMVFSPDGNLAYLINNAPDELLVLDTSLSSTTVFEHAGPRQVVSPAYRFLSAVPVFGRPSALAYVARDGGDLLVTPSFTTDELMLTAVHSASLVPLLRLSGVGAGPFDVEVINDGDDRLLLISTFYDHGITFVRIPATEASAATVIARVRSEELGDASPR